MKKYPRRLYVFRENAGTKEEFFLAEEDASELADRDQNIIGVYELVKTAKIKLIVEYEEK